MKELSYLLLAVLHPTTRVANVVYSAFLLGLATATLGMLVGTLVGIAPETVAGGILLVAVIVDALLHAQFVTDYSDE